VPPLKDRLGPVPVPPAQAQAHQVALLPVALLLLARRLR